ncbi:hypothetical protein ACJX0J_009029 [Zea mays]
MAFPNIGDLEQGLFFTLLSGITREAAAVMEGLQHLTQISTLIDFVYISINDIIIRKRFATNLSERYIIVFNASNQILIGHVLLPSFNQLYIHSNIICNYSLRYDDVNGQKVFFNGYIFNCATNLYAHIFIMHPLVQIYFLIVKDGLLLSKERGLYKYGIFIFNIIPGLNELKSTGFKYLENLPFYYRFLFELSLDIWTGQTKWILSGRVLMPCGLVWFSRPWTRTILEGQALIIRRA